MKQSIEVALHNSSLSLASIYHELSNSNDDHQATMVQIMVAYRETRRAMEKNHEGKRFGHAEAYRAMTFGEQPNAAKDKEYRQKNKEKISARKKEYRLNNQEKISARKKEYRLNNQEKI